MTDAAPDPVKEPPKSNLDALYDYVGTFALAPPVEMADLVDLCARVREALNSLGLGRMKVEVGFNQQDEVLCAIYEPERFAPIYERRIPQVQPSVSEPASPSA